MFQFECDPHGMGDRISRVDEPQSCEYIITISTPRTCVIKQLRPEETPKPKEISCSPMFTKDQYLRWEERIAKEKLEEAKQLQESKARHKEEMLKIVKDEDISAIDVDTDEGMALLENMVGNKMADKLMLSLNDFLEDGKMKSKDSEEYEDVELPSGEKKTVLRSKSKENPDKLGFEAENDPNKDPKSGAVSYDDLLQDVVSLLKKMSDRKDSKLDQDFFQKLKKEVKDSMEPEIEEILDETAREMDVELDGKSRHESLESIAGTLKSILDQVDVAEAEIAKVSKEIEEKKKTIEKLKEEGVAPKGKEDDEVNEFGKETEGKTESQTERETVEETEGESEEESEGESEGVSEGESEGQTERETEALNQMETKEGIGETGEDKVVSKDPGEKLKFKNIPTIEFKGLMGTDSEKRVVKHLEAAIKQKLSSANVDTGGRAIEVKVITGNPYLTKSNLDGSMGDPKLKEEQNQLQGLLYNLMVNNQDGYKDIEQQMSSEQNYKFVVDSMETKDQLETNDETSTDNEDSNEPSPTTIEEESIEDK